MVNSGNPTATSTPKYFSGHENFAKFHLHDFLFLSGPFPYSIQTVDFGAAKPHLVKSAKTPRQISKEPISFGSIAIYSSKIPWIDEPFPGKKENRSANAPRTYYGLNWIHGLRIKLKQATFAF